jgi:hypothetical protein
MRSLSLVVFLLLLGAPSFADNGRASEGRIELRPFFERGDFIREGDVYRDAVKLDFRGGIELEASDRIRIDAGYSLALRSAALDAAPDYVRQGPWIALRFEF